MSFPRSWIPRLEELGTAVKDAAYNMEAEEGEQGRATGKGAQFPDFCREFGRGLPFPEAEVATMDICSLVARMMYRTNEARIELI